jgi:two-component system sensor histidine kinase BaeS
MSRLPLVAKIVGIIVMVLVATGAAQAALLARGAPGHLAVAGPLLVPPLLAWPIGTYIVRFRMQALIVAFTRMADGALDTELPPAPDADMAPVREAFNRMAAALRASTERLRHADAQRRRLFADLVHELATPTSTILGLTEALASPALCPDEATRARLLALLEREGTRLERFVEDMRELGALDDPDVAMEPAPADVGAIARAAVERVDLAGPPGAPIRCATESVVADVDASRIEQVLGNLLVNARRYTPAEGRIEVHVSRRGEGVRLVVEDSGEGVPDALLPRLGQRLFRADASRSRRTGGHGLGLSIAGAVVHRHGGRLSFERAALGGLRAVIDLPLASQPAQGPGSMTTTGIGPGAR